MEFLHGTGLLELALELLQSPFDVLPFFHRYYNHLVCLLVLG